MLCGSPSAAWWTSTVRPVTLNIYSLNFYFTRNFQSPILIPTLSLKPFVLPQSLHLYWGLLRILPNWLRELKCLMIWNTERISYLRLVCEGTHRNQTGEHHKDLQNSNTTLSPYFQSQPSSPSQPQSLGPIPQPSVSLDAQAYFIHPGWENIIKNVMILYEHKWCQMLLAGIKCGKMLSHLIWLVKQLYGRTMASLS